MSSTSYSPLSPSFNPFQGTAMSPSFIPAVIYTPPPPISPSSIVSPSPVIAPRPKLLSSQEIESRLKLLTRSSPAAFSASSSAPAGSPSSSNRPASSTTAVRSLDFSSDSTSNPASASNSTTASPTLSPAGSPSRASTNGLIGTQRPGDDLIVYFDDEAQVPAGYSPVDRLSGTISPFTLGPAYLSNSSSSLVDDLGESSSSEQLNTTPSKKKQLSSSTPLRVPSPMLSIKSPEFVPQPERPAQWVMQLPEDVTFSSPFTLWFDQPSAPGHSALEYASALKPLCSLCTIRSFWQWTLNLPEPTALPFRTTYHWMREHVLPLWEDEENVLGGNVSLHIRSEDATYAWNRLTLGMMGGQIAVPAPDQLTGISVSLRRGHTVFHVWNKRADAVDVEIFIASILAVIPDARITTAPFYRLHKDLVQTHEERVEAAKLPSSPSTIPINPPSSPKVSVTPAAVHKPASASPTHAPIPRHPPREPVPIFRHIQQPRGGSRSPRGGFKSSRGH